MTVDPDRPGERPSGRQPPEPGPDDEDGDEDQPWPITHPPPGALADWMTELLGAYARVGATPTLTTSDGQPVKLASRGVLEDAVLLGLEARGVSVPQESIEDLISVVSELSADLRAMGPEWHTLQQVPPLAFTVFYVWAHIVIGHLHEERAMEVVGEATQCLEDFEAQARGRGAAGAPDADGSGAMDGDETGDAGGASALGPSGGGSHQPPPPAPRARPPRRGGRGDAGSRASRGRPGRRPGRP